jgi:hypothetical protein
LQTFLQGWRARLAGKAGGQGWRARLAGKAAGQGCRARLPGKVAGQGCPDRKTDFYYIGTFKIKVDST